MSLINGPDQLREVIGIPFSEAQMAAITADLDAPVAIIAGAGSGKTTVMAARVVWLVGHVGIPAERILGLTFTTKAAAELGQRISANLERLGVDLDGQPTTATYHAFAGQLIAEHGLRIGIEPDLSITTNATRFQRLAKAIESFDGDLSLLSTHLPTLVTQTMSLEAEMSEHLASVDDVREFCLEQIAEIDACPKLTADLRRGRDAQLKRLELLQLVQLYRSAKERDAVMDFSDQMAGGAQLAALPAVRAALRERFDVVLLDEYQDTSVAQRDLLLQLFGGMGVTAVGDPAQGIYGWRGAATGNLENFVSEFSLPDGPSGRHFSLVQTRRCAPQIIAAANHVAAPFYARSAAVQPLESAVDRPGFVDVALHPTVADEIDAMTTSIHQVHAEGTPWREIAILTRVTRENANIVPALRRADIPFEIVGLNGLLDQPEIVDVVSLLSVVDDVTANPQLLRLLTGPRWNIGARDLALLGRRAAQLTGRTPQSGGDDLEDELARAVEGTDPTDIVSLADALEDPGELGFSSQARERFAQLSQIITSTRAHGGDPLIDLVRRAVRALDLDVELEATGVIGASDNLSLFLDAVADYSQTDRFASLSGLLAYLRAEDLYNEGLEVSTPSDADSVKLLTIHKAKGLEWDAVFVPFVSKNVFPGARGRSNWAFAVDTLPWPLRGDAETLPELTGWSRDELKAFADGLREESVMEERRLAYVAYTRARTRLVISGHWWGRTQKKPRGPSVFLDETRTHLQALGHEPLVWTAPPDDDTVNPMVFAGEHVDWPANPPAMQRRRRLAAAVHDALGAPAVVESIDPVTGATAREPDETRDSVGLSHADELDIIAGDVELLLAEADALAATHRDVPLPSTLSATGVLQLAKDEAGFARSIARPMPRKPSSAARFGTRFHAWVESYFGQQPLIDPADLPGRADVHIESDQELDDVIELFRTGPFGDSVPHSIEAPFSIVLAGQQVIGRIDAVFARGSGDERRYEVVDWKTNRSMDADPLQLAIYRLAWAELMDVDLDRVGAAFYYVRHGQVQRFDDLPDRAALESLLADPAATLRA